MLNVYSKSKEQLVHYVMDMYSCFLIYTSIIQRGNDLLEEQLYEDYYVAYFPNVNSWVVPPNSQVIIIIMKTISLKIVT